MRNWKNLTNEKKYQYCCIFAAIMMLIVYRNICFDLLDQLVLGTLGASVLFSSHLMRWLGVL